MKRAGDPGSNDWMQNTSAARDQIPLAHCCKDPNHVVVGDAVNLALSLSLPICLSLFLGSDKGAYIASRRLIIRARGQGLG